MQPTENVDWKESCLQWECLLKVKVHQQHSKQEAWPDQGCLKASRNLPCSMLSNNRFKLASPSPSPLICFLLASQASRLAFISASLILFCIFPLVVISHKIFTSGLDEREFKAVHCLYLSHIRLGRPFVILVIIRSGKIGLPSQSLRKSLLIGEEGRSTVYDRWKLCSKFLYCLSVRMFRHRRPKVAGCYLKPILQDAFGFFRHTSLNLSIYSRRPLRR